MIEKAFNQWDSKFIREYPFMAFGSLVKAYSEINQGKGRELPQFKKDVEELFEFAQELVYRALEKSKEIETQIEKEEVEIPMKK